MRHRWARDWNRAEGKIARITYVGDMLACEVSAGGVGFLVEQPTLPGLAAPREGDACALAWRLTDTLVFPRDAA